MGGTPRRRLRVRGRVHELGERPWLMGVVNASPDSFSDPGEADLDERAARGRALVQAGADVVDVGGESAITGRPAVPVEEEIARVVPLVERLAAVAPLVSVDTYKPAVAEAALAAGAGIVNDLSGLRDPELADVCAATGAALVLAHTRAAPKQRLQDPGRYEDVTADVVAFLRERTEIAIARGVDPEQLLLDPGPDLSKTPAQTIALLRRVQELHALGRPLLLAVSRKDFIGALTGRRPADRGAGTLAALEHGLQAGGHVFRLHDVAAARDFLMVREALSGAAEPPADLALTEDIRHQERRPPDAPLQSSP